MSTRYLTARLVQERIAELSELDRAVLHSVSDLRFVSGQQLVRLHYGADPAAARAARRALARLIDLELLNRLPRRVGGVRAGSAGFVYCLGIAGQKLAMAAGWQPTRRGRRVSTPGLLFLDHRLAVAELHVRLREADRQGRLELLELVAEPECHRHYAGLGNLRVLKPDSFLRFNLGDWEHAVFIEVDRGTEGSGALQRKLSDYLHYQASGSEQQRLGMFPRVLFTAPEEERAAVIRGEIRRLPEAARGPFAVSEFAVAIDAVLTPGNASN